jgi:hypothetical protein
MRSWLGGMEVTKTKTSRKLFSYMANSLARGWRVVMCNVGKWGVVKQGKSMRQDHYGFQRKRWLIEPG